MRLPGAGDPVYEKVGALRVADLFSVGGSVTSRLTYTIPDPMSMRRIISANTQDTIVKNANVPIVCERENYFDPVLACGGNDVVQALQTLRTVVQYPLATVPHLRVTFELASTQYR